MQVLTIKLKKNIFSIESYVRMDYKIELFLMLSSNKNRDKKCKYDGVVSILGRGYCINTYIKAVVVFDKLHIHIAYL